MEAEKLSLGKSCILWHEHWKFKENFLMTEAKQEFHPFNTNLTVRKLPYTIYVLLLACTKTVVWRLGLWYIHIKLDPVVCIMHIRPLWKMVEKKNLVLFYLSKVFQWILFYFYFWVLSSPFVFVLRISLDLISDYKEKIDYAQFWNKSTRLHYLIHFGKCGNCLKTCSIFWLSLAAVITSLFPMHRGDRINSLNRKRAKVIL